MQKQTVVIARQAKQLVVQVGPVAVATLVVDGATEKHLGAGDVAYITLPTRSAKSAEITRKQGTLSTSVGALNTDGKFEAFRDRIKAVNALNAALYARLAEYEAKEASVVAKVNAVPASAARYDPREDPNSDMYDPLAVAKERLTK